MVVRRHLLLFGFFLELESLLVTPGGKFPSWNRRLFFCESSKDARNGNFQRSVWCQCLVSAAPLCCLCQRYLLLRRGLRRKASWLPTLAPSILSVHLFPHRHDFLLCLFGLVIMLFTTPGMQWMKFTTIVEEFCIYAPVFFEELLFHVVSRILYSRLYEKNLPWSVLYWPVFWSGSPVLLKLRSASYWCCL